MLSIDLNYILIQLFHPYFYYSTTLLVISFICVKALAKYNRLLTSRMKSICYLFPLMIPLLLITLTSPWLITRLLLETRTLGYNPRSMFLPPIVFNHAKPLDNPPLTSMLLAVGLTLSAFYMLIAATLNDRVAKRVFRIVELEPNEYRSLQRRVEELSKKLGINPPKIGLTEDLRPNAFTVGYGRRTMLVFSLGILKTLKEKELAAVAAHELAHVKNNDFLFKTLSVALALISFFNPFAYFASATAQRERETLADEESARILEQPGLLAKTLIKIHEASREFPKEDIITRLASGLFLSSPTSVGMLLSTHPKLDQRVENIRRLVDRQEPTPTNPLLSIAISILIIAAGIISMYYLASIQSSFIRQYLPSMSLKTPLEEKGLIPVHILDRARMHVFDFFKFKNSFPNNFNKSRPEMMVLTIEENSQNYLIIESCFNIYSLKV